MKKFTVSIEPGSLLESPEFRRVLSLHLKVLEGKMPARELDKILRRLRKRRVQW